MRVWLRNIRFAFHMVVEHPLVTVFGRTSECGCQTFRGKLRFICAQHFLLALRTEHGKEIN